METSRSERSGRSMLLARHGLAALVLTLGVPCAFALRADFPATDEPFTDASVVRGVRADRGQCDALRGAEWAQPEGGDGECLRYWHAGLDTAKGAALFFFGGDLLVGNAVYKGYAGQTSAGVQRSIDNASARYAVPYVFVARPGTYGSSGEHKQRRRAPEARIVSAAIDAIKKRHGLSEIAVAGFSGGGHVVASLLGYRSDIVCAVPASAVSSPRMRTQLRGWSVDSTGYPDSYEPASNLAKKRMHPSLRVFVLGDPGDGNVPWAVQTFLADRLRAEGVPTEVLQAEGLGSERHVVVQSALLVGSMCLLNKTSDEIRQRAGEGLKG